MGTYLDSEGAHHHDNIDRIVKDSVVWQPWIIFSNCSYSGNSCNFCDNGHEVHSAQIDDMAEATGF